MSKLSVITNPITEAIKAIKDTPDPYKYVDKLYTIISKVKTALHMADFEANNTYDGEKFQIKITGSILFRDNYKFEEQYFKQNRTELLISYRESKDTLDTEFNSVNESINITDVIDHKKMLGIVFNSDGEYCKSGVFARAFETEDTMQYYKLLNSGIIKRFYLKAPLLLNIGYECENVKEYCWQIAASCEEKFVTEVTDKIRENKHTTEK